MYKDSPVFIMGDKKTISEIITFKIQFRITILTMHNNFTVIQILA